MTQPLSVYLPMDRRQALARGEPLAERGVGVALLADIAGFTPLTEGLVRAGGPLRGAEEVTAVLNGAYGVLVDAVDAFGGSVICFSGDAITCWFGAGPDDGPLDTGLRAAACALAMQQAMAAFAAIPLPGGGSAALSVSVALAGGPARRLLVGDPALQRYEVLAGGLLDRLAALQHLARAGEVLADGPLARSLAPRARISWRDTPAGEPVAAVSGLAGAVAPAPWPDLPAAPADADCRPWLLPAVAARLAHTPAPFLAELRPAVALMLEFHGLDYDADEAAGARLDAYLRWVQRVVARYEGALIDLTMGDRGSYLYAAWGAPEAHDDDAARAVAAARELLAPPRAFPWLTGVRAGLARGTLWCGDYGGPTRRTYGVLGDATNLAFRLMSTAPAGAIWCDYAVVGAAGRRWSFAGLPPVRVKGKAGLIRVYTPVEPAAQRAAPQATSLVGREGERAQLAATLDAVMAGGSRVVVLEGEAGIGKSRLVDELAQLLRARGVAGLLGAGQSVERHTPYRAWRDLAGAFFDLKGVAGAAARRARVAATVQALRPDLVARLPLLNDVLALELPETPQTRAFDPARRSEQLERLLIELLGAWTREQPLALVLEDAHWMDSRSWDVTVRVARALSAAGQPLLLLLTTRPLPAASPEAAALGELLSLEGAARIPLGALADDAILALAAARLGLAPGGLSGEVASLIQRRSGGNPFFAEELVDMLRQHALIQPAGDPDGGGGSRYVASPALAQGAQLLPDTLQGLLLARIDRLPPDEQLTLKVAAVVGATFTYPPLRHARARSAPADDATLRRHLEALTAHDLTVPLAGDPEPAYRFTHILAQEAAYQTLLYAQRRSLHRSVAEWYERREAPAADDPPPAPLEDRRSPLLPLLAHHYRHAEDEERERHYARLAGIHAADQYANSEALAFFTRALELTPPDDLAGRFDLMLERLNIHLHQEQVAALAGELERMEPLADALNDDRRRALCAARRAVVAALTSDYSGAIATARRAVALAEAAGEPRIVIAAHRTWAYALGHQGNLAAADAQLQIVLRLAREDGDRASELKALNNLGIFLAMSGDIAAGNPYFQKSLELSRELGDGLLESIALRNLGTVAFFTRRYAAARAYCEQSLQVARAVGVTTAERTIPCDLGRIAQGQGDYDAALRAYEESLRHINAVADPSLECDIVSELTRLFWNQGAYDTARVHGQRALQLAQTLGDVRMEAQALISLAHVGLALGQAAEARLRYRSGLDKARSMGHKTLTLEAEAGLARVALAEGDLRDALAHVDAILAALEAGSLDGAAEPFLVDLTCYQTLRAAGDPRAAAVLEAAHARLQQGLGSIADEAGRRMFLENVPAHRELAAAWRALRGGAPGAQ